MNMEDIKRYSDLHLKKVNDFYLIANELTKLTNGEYVIESTVEKNKLAIKNLFNINIYNEFAKEAYHLLCEIEDIESNKIDEEIIFISKRIPEIEQIKSISKDQYNNLYNLICSKNDNPALLIIIDEIFNYYKNGDKIII